MHTILRLSVIALPALVFLMPAPAADQADTGVLSFCVIPDAHTYTGSLRYLPAIVEKINALPVQPDFVVSLGDNVSGGEDHDVIGDAVRYHECIAALNAPHYYVIGNHECIPIEYYKLLTWKQLLGAWGMQSRWYSSDIRGLHLCVVDSWSPLPTEAFAAVWQAQQEWLVADLAATDKPTVVFAHEAIGFQQEDLQDWIDTDNRKFWPAGNFFETTLQAHAGKIVGVFEGHKHKSLYKTQGGVTYHQMGASHACNGQFAQVFIDMQTRAWFVQGYPDVSPEQQDAKGEMQITYGDRSVMEKAIGHQ